MKNFVSCHVHQSSLDTASTPEAFAEKEIELGTGYLVTTDHGTLQAARRVYDLAKKKKLTPIIGLEAYLRDDDCPILRRMGIEPQHPADGKGVLILDKDGNPLPKTMGHHLKYMHVTMAFKDADAYETAVRLISRADGRAEKHGSERKPLFTWADLEELGSKNVTMTSSCLVGAVQRHLVDHDDLVGATAYYEKLRSCVKPGNFYAEVFPHKCDKNWDSSGYITYADGTRERLKSTKKLKLREAGEVYLADLAKRWRSGRQDQLLAVMNNRRFEDREPKIVSKVEVLEGFVVNECRPWAENGDVQAGANMAILYLADKYGDKVVIGDDSHYAKAEEKVVQDIRLQSMGGSWRFYGHYHRQSSQEALKHFQETIGVEEKEFAGWVDNSYEWAEGFKGFTFKERKSLPTSFYPADTLAHTMSLIEKHGRMQWGNPVWVERLGKEIEMLLENGKVDLLPYFMIDEEVCSFFASKGKLTGPGRGSAAGLLLAYLLRITHLDPIKYQLSMERFLTASRIRSGKWPDIDQDVPKSARDLLIDPVNGWLRQRFGQCYAHISVDTSLKLRSAVKDVARVRHDGHVPEEIEQLTRKFLDAPQGISDHNFIFGYKGSDGWVDGSMKDDEALQSYVRLFPKEWEVVQQCLGLTRQKAPHACAFVIADEPISNFIPMTRCGDEPVTQYTAPSVEAVGGLKMDFLGLRALDDIGGAIQIIQQRAGWKPVDMVIDGELVLAHEIVPFQGKFYSIWKLPEDQAVFHDFCEGKTETVFQFNTPGAIGWLKNFNYVKETLPDGTIVKALNSIESLSAFTALDRPGPLDYFLKDASGESLHNMLVEYAIRARGGAPTGALPVLDELLPETHGVIVYQEQLQRVYQAIGQTSAEQADEFRIHISKKKMADVIKDKEIFMPGAVKLLGEEVANTLWQSMETFGQYGFNKSHATAYVTISYASAYLKHHFHLEWWTSILQHADKDKISTEYWKFCGHLIDLPDVALGEENFSIVNERIRAPLNLLHGVGDSAHEQLMKYRPYASLEDFCQKIQDHREANATFSKKEKKVTTKIKQGRKVVGTTEEIVTVEVKKMGYNSLHKGVIATLIISGAMDSFFPPDTLSLEALAKFNETMAQVAGKKVEPVDPKYTTLNSFVKYQMRKAILPAYSEPITAAVVRSGYPGVVLSKVPGMKPEFTIDGKTTPFGSYDEIQFIENRKPWPEDYTFLVAAAGYVVEARRFNYGEGKAKEALELIVDIDGGRMTAVKWGGKKGKLPSHLSKGTDWNGAIVVVFYSKYSEGRPFVVEDIAMIQPPLNLSAPVEASPDQELSSS